MGYAFGLLDRVLFLFSDCHSYALCGICFMLGIAHFSALDDSTASLFILCKDPGPGIRIRF